MKNIILSASYDLYAAHKLYRDDWSLDKNRDVFGHCSDLHGHQYKIEVNLSGSINENTGMLINGYDVDRIIKETVLKEADHKYLNDLQFFQEHQPTVEWIAYWAYTKLKKAFPENCHLTSVRVYETPTLFAQYSE